MTETLAGYMTAQNDKDKRKINKDAIFWTRLTPDQAKWLRRTSKETLNSYSTILRWLVQKEMERESYTQINGPI